MNIKRGKSLIAFVLVFAMLLTMIPIKNRVMAAETGTATLKFVSATTGGTFKFKGTLSDGSYIPKGYYKVLATIENDSGNTTKDILMEVGDNGTISIWKDFFQYNNAGANTPPTKSLTFAKGAILTQVALNGTWSEVENGNVYTLGKEMSIECDESGVWSVVMEHATLAFVSGTTGETFKFTGTLSDGSYIPNGYYKVLATIENDSGNTTKDILMEVQNNGTVLIYDSFFQYNNNAASTPPTKSLMFAKGVILTQVALNGTWSEVENGNVYKLSEELSIVNESGTWIDSAKVESMAEMTLDFSKVTPSNAFYYTGTLVGEGTLSEGCYKVSANIGVDGGTTTKDVVVQIMSGNSVVIWENFFSEKPGNIYTVPTSSLEFVEGAILTQVNTSGWGIMENGQSYKLSGGIRIEKNQFGLWDIDVETTDLGSLTMALNNVNNNNFYFTSSLANGGTLTNGSYYKGVATIETDTGTVTQFITLGIGSNNAINIYSGFFTWNNNANNKIPTKSFKIVANTTFREVYNDGSWKETLEGKTPTSFTVARSLSLVNEDGTWCEEVIPEDDNGASIVLGFKTVATGSNTFYFTGTLTDGSKLTEGYYKVAATIGRDGGTVTKEVVVQVDGNGNVIIYKDFFSPTPSPSSTTIPTQSFQIAKNAILTEVSTSGWGVVENGKTYKLSKEICIQKNQFGIWDLDVETTDLGSLTMAFNNVTNNNFYFTGSLANGGTLTNGSYYKGVATIETDTETVTQFITLGIGSNNALSIYSGFFTWNNQNNKIPTKSFKIVANTTFRQVYNDGSWKETLEGETPTSFTVAMNLSLVNKDGTWCEEVIPGDANGDGVTNVCDLVRYVKYDLDSENTMIATGADINGNGKYDDLDNLRQLLVGANIPVATCFSLVQNGASDYKIVTPANATTNEMVAANELQYFIKESTGATLAIESETNSITADSGKYIYLGDTEAAEEASATLASSVQKKNGYLIKTVEDDCYLRGYSDIGTKNAVYEFLDHAFDYEYYAVDEIYLTKTSNVKLLNFDLESSPDFEWRLAPNGEVIYTANGSFATSTTGVVANRMRFNLASDIFVTKYDFHNGYTILPPATYLEAHPDWYSRDIEDNTITYTSDAGTLPAQLCYSSASMREQFTIELLELLETTTVANVMLGQQDTKYWCECEACSAAKEQYGTNAAVLVQFANAVQADVNTWFVENRPGKTPTRMVIFAYQSTSQPAVKWDEQSQTWTAIDETVILNEDSSVMFAIGDMQMHVPFAETDSSSLSTPYGRILGWEACSNSIFAWTYSLYMNHGLLFSNTIDVMAQNYRLLAEHGVTMIQDQADSYQKYKNSGFSRLETYLMGKMQWDTSLNQEQLIDDFFANYFGEAADTMQTLFNLERKNILAKYEDESIGFKGTFGEDVLTTDFWPQDELEAYKALIQQAYSDIASLEATDAERYARLYERILLESMQFDYIDCSLYNTDIANRNEFKNNFEELGMYSYSEHKSIGSLWKAWGIQYGQVMSYSYTNDANSFNFVLHKGSETGWYQAEAYVDGVLTPVLIEVTGSNSAWIYWHSFNNNNSSNTTKQPTTSLVIRPGTLMKPVVTNSWNQQDMSRPSYKLETQLYITKTENGWVAGDTISAKPTGITMNFEYTSDKNKNGKYDFAFSTNQAITNGWYKADAVIDGKVQSVLLQVIDLSDSSSRVWIYEGCFNDNAKLSDSVLPQSTFVITKGTVLSPVIASKYTVDSERIGYQLTQELNITNTNGEWQ